MSIRKCLRSCFCDCVCVRWPCWDHWRMWCKPLMIILYLIVLFVMLPLLVYGLYQEHAEAEFKAWFVAGIFLLLTIPIFLLGLMQHLFNYTRPQLQKHIIRILWMVPIYSLDSWLGLKFPKAAVYLDTARECYESYVLYNFLCYLLNFLEFEYNLNAELEAKPPVRQPIPFCCCPPWPKGEKFVRRCKIGVLQYTVVRIVLTLIALITQLCKVYDKGHLKLNRAFLYISLMNAVSQIIALHSLIYFYKGTRELLKPIHPVGKFLSIKAIVFFTFWQSILITLIVKIKPISNLWSQYDDADIAEAFQNFVICIEMFFFAIAHYFVFSHKPYVDPAAAQAPCIHSCFKMLDVSDVAGDVRVHFVDPISIPRPNFKRIKRSFGEKSYEATTTTSSIESETDPLLKSNSSGSGNGESSKLSSGPNGLSDGSLSYSVLTYDKMKVQQRVSRMAPVSDVIEEKNEGAGGSGSVSSDSTENKDELKLKTNSTPSGKPPHSDSRMA